MRYLLDTNIFVYLIEHNYSQLSNAQKDILRNTENEFYLSEASYYELSIKARILKQLNFKFDIAKLDEYRQIFKIKLLKSKTDYYLGILEVPKVYLTENKLHGDPFDLLIISQAKIEKMPILSSDKLYPNCIDIEVIS